MEQLIKDLQEQYKLVLYHDDRANLSDMYEALQTMLNTTSMIVDKCNHLIREIEQWQS